jgi:hypothetical protein
MVLDPENLIRHCELQTPIDTDFVGGLVGAKVETGLAFWKSLRGWVKEHAILIPRKVRVHGRPREIWAFPSAVAAFKNGRSRDYNP